MKLYFLFITVIVANATAIYFYNVFQNNSVELSYNELGFFETPNYPQLHNSTKFFLFNTTFFTTDESPNGTRCVLVLRGLSWYYTPFRNVEDTFVFETANFFLQTFHYVVEYYSAFSGYVYFEDKDDSCPLESISRYNFTNENEILFFGSVYQNKTNFNGIPTLIPNRLQPCFWQFSAPEGYGFKLVIQTFNVDQRIKFQVYNTTDLLINEHSARSNHVYYNADHHLEISLSKNNSVISTEMEFEAYISIVEQNFTKNDTCIITNYGKDKWTFSSASNLTHGYENNVKCTYNITVTNATTILATVDQMSLEKNVDRLYFYDKDYYHLLNYHDQFMLESHGDEKTFYFVFESDDNFQSSGFLITFEENVCECGNSVILCNNVSQTVMKETDYICQNLKCVFSIEPCLSEYTFLYINATNYQEIDSIKVTSNETVVYDSTFNKFDSNGEVFLISENDNKIEVKSVSTERKTTTFKAATFSLPMIETHVILTADNTHYILDESAVSSAIIEVDPFLIAQNISIVVSGFNFQQCNKRYYVDETLNKEIVLKNCSSSVTYKCETEINKLVYYSDPEIYRELNGCYTAFTLTKGKKSVISAMSKSSGNCVLTILKDAESVYVLSDIFTNSASENVKIYIKAKENILFLEFNKKTLHKFRNIKFLSDAYTVSMPKNSDVQLTLTLNSIPYQESVFQSPYQSLFSTMFYGRKKCSYSNRHPVIIYNIGNVGIKLTVLHFVTNTYAYIEVNNTKNRINEVGDSFVFYNTKVSIYHGSSTQEYCGAFFFVETI